MKNALYRVLTPALRVYLTRLSQRRLPPINGALTIPGLSSEVEIIRDRWGVPHLYAKTLPDLFFAQGFVHAQERLWQMELNRRTALGRLSELFGPIALKTDRAVRVFGFNRLARLDWSQAGDSLKVLLQAYSDGINAFLQHPSTKFPVEFTLVGYQPEPWRPEHTLAFTRLMMWQLSHAWYSEIVRAQLIEAVGEQRAAEWEIDYPHTNPVTLPNGIEFNHLEPDGGLHLLDNPFLERGKGSNAWAVTGRKTLTGKPYLCNDAHLGLKAPALWYQNHLVAGNFNVTGVSLPGAPFILIGHNAHIAWGITLAFTDCEDIFIEKFDPVHARRYQFGESWREAQVITEAIHVKGRQEPHLEQVLMTHHGPLISGVLGTAQQRLALSSMSLRAPSVLPAMWQLNQAANWAEFTAAMRLIEAPQLNIVYADTAGNIGYWLTGQVPIRAQGQGLVPAPGWSGEYEWTGVVPFEEMPHALNPSAGYVISCNHRVVNDNYAYFLGNVWMNGYRARRLQDLFAQKKILTVEDFQAMHMDVVCLPGQEFVQHFADLTCSDPTLQQALGYLQSWNGQLSPDSIGGTLYEVIRYRLIRALLEPVLEPKLVRRLTGAGFNPVLAITHEFYGYDTVNLLKILSNPDSWWLAQAGGKTVLLQHSLEQAVAWLKTKLGPDMSQWQWGKLHRTIFPHALGAKKPLDRIFSRGPYPIGGDTDTLCQTAMLPTTPYDNNAWGPSIRQIIDLSDLSRSVIIVPPGQSGHIASPHYDDQLQPWLKGEYHPMLWTRRQVEAAAEGTLRLTPQTTWHR